MATGKQSGQSGNVAPVLGEFEIRQQSSATDLLTLSMAEGASTGAGKAMVVKRWAEPGSSEGVAMFEVGYDGVYGRRKVTTLSSASTGVTLASSQSGMFVVVPGMTSGLTVTLPAPEAGLWYELYVKANLTSGLITLKSASTGLVVAYGNAAADAIVIGKTVGTEIGGSMRVHSDGTQWYSLFQPAVSSLAPTSATMTMMAIVDA